MIGIKKALDEKLDSTVIGNLEKEAIAARIRMLKLGHELHIRLHYGAMMSCVEILIDLC